MSLDAFSDQQSAGVRWKYSLLRYGNIGINLIKYSQMSSPTKPINQYFNQQRYLRHKQKLVTIEGQRPKPLTIHQHTSFQKLRNYSIAFRAQLQEEHINHQNQQFLQKLLDISKRKNSIYAPNNTTTPKIPTFQNPARKKRQKMITIMNQQMAERLLHRESQLDRKAMRRSIEQYQRLKKSLLKNKRILSQTSQFGPSLPLFPKKSWAGPEANPSFVNIKNEIGEQNTQSEGQVRE